MIIRLALHNVHVLLHVFLLGRVAEEMLQALRHLILLHLETFHCFLSAEGGLGLEGGCLLHDGLVSDQAHHLVHHLCLERIWLVEFDILADVFGRRANRLRSPVQELVAQLVLFVCEVRHNLRVVTHPSFLERKPPVFLMLLLHHDHLSLGLACHYFTELGQVIKIESSVGFVSLWLAQGLDLLDQGIVELCFLLVFRLDDFRLWSLRVVGVSYSGNSYSAEESKQNLFIISFHFYYVCG
jgi:hypothetical protein